MTDGNTGSATRDEESERIDSRSVGASDCFQPLDWLEETLRGLNPPRDRGRVALIVRRGKGGVREVLARVGLTPGDGIPGDAWGRARQPDPATQLAVMQWDVARAIAGGQPPALFGDNLFLDLDLSAGNLPPGSRLRAGAVTLEVTSEPHTGCGKFRRRFGDEALRFISRPDLQHLNLRGVYMRVIDGGELATGDVLDVVSRPG